MKCDQASTVMTVVAFGEASDAEAHQLQLHVAACAPCAERWAEEQALLDQVARRRQPDAEPALLARYRARLRAALEEEPAPGRHGWLPGWLGLGWPHLELAPSLAALLVLAGFCGGWFARYRGAAPADGTAQQAALFGEGQDPVRVDAVQPDADGQVRVTYDALERRAVAGSPASPAMQQLLVFAAQHPLNSGVRLDSIDALKSRVAEDEVRQTLLLALQQDPNPGVRLKALDSLSPQVGVNAEVREVLVRTVLRDANPGVRAEAIAALSRAPRDDAAALLQQVASQTQDLYVRLRCAGLLRQMDLATPPNLRPLPAAPAPQPEIQ